MNTGEKLRLICQEGEGYYIEFKEKISNLDREITAFANASGGSIFIGINGQGDPIGIEVSNGLKSEITDIARNCDPSIKISFEHYREQKVLEIKVSEGQDKPYRCKSGFYMRMGPSSQKLTRNEIRDLILENQGFRYDEQLHPKFIFPEDFSVKAFKEFLSLMSVNTSAASKDVLISLNLMAAQNKLSAMTNTGVLFFANNPQKFFPESMIACVRYAGIDRYAIEDKKEMKGNPFEQIEGALSFMMRHMSEAIVVKSQVQGQLGRHRKQYDYPVEALREAITNAIVHRDYYYDSAHIYVSLFSDRLEIDNPGGLVKGMTIDYLGKRSVRRNRLIADVLHRAGYIERVGSGFSRMHRALEENNNPPLEVVSSNFFTLRFFPRLKPDLELSLTARQAKIIQLLRQYAATSKRDIAHNLGAGEDTILRELKILIQAGIVIRSGQGRSTRYALSKQ